MEALHQLSHLLVYLHLLLTTRILQAGLSAAHFCADLPLCWSLVVKGAQLWIKTSCRQSKTAYCGLSQHESLQIVD